MQITKNTDLFDGIKDSIVFAPMLLSIAVSYFIVAESLGFTSLEIFLWHATMNAGTVQIAILSAYAGGAGVPELLLVAFMTSVRFSFIAMSLSVLLRDQINARLLPIFAFFIVDPFAGAISARIKKPGNHAVYSFTFLLSFWVQWVLMALAIVMLGPFIPPAWEPAFYFAVPAAFIALVFLMIKDKLLKGLVVVFTAIILSLLFTLFTTPQVSVIIATLIASFVGVIVEEKGGID